MHHAPVIVGFFYFLSEAFFSADDLDLVEAMVDNDAPDAALDFLGVLPSCNVGVFVMVLGEMEYRVSREASDSQNHSF